MALEERAAKTPSFTREVYGTDKDNKPNDYYYWCPLFYYWTETDDHLRKRIQGESQ